MNRNESIFRPSATVSRIGPMESCTCRRGGPSTPLAGWRSAFALTKRTCCPRRFCSLENEPEERHPMNQSILFNHGKFLSLSLSLSNLSLFLQTSQFLSLHQILVLLICPPGLTTKNVFPISLHSAHQESVIITFSPLTLFWPSATIS